MAASDDVLSLAQWRRTIAELYATIRHQDAPEMAWAHFCAVRDDLFLTHPQTPLNSGQRSAFSSLPYFPYDPACRVWGKVVLLDKQTSFSVELPADGLFRFTRIATVHFDLYDQPLQLGLYWVDGYGGGLFLPFRDKTNNQETYGGGRYLYDGIKGADLGTVADQLLLDFNFAYNPSCAYNDQWVCPLAPVENQLPIAIYAGERRAVWKPLEPL